VGRDERWSASTKYIVLAVAVVAALGVAAEYTEFREYTLYICTNTYAPYPQMTRLDSHRLDIHVESLSPGQVLELFNLFASGDEAGIGAKIDQINQINAIPLE
jgi:hypothetical protein